MARNNNHNDSAMFEWVEMLDAEWIGEKGKGTLFRFATHNKDCWIATSRCKREDNKFFVEEWAARQNMHEWGAEFVLGTQGGIEQAQMRAQQINLPYEVADELRKLARRMLELLREQT